MSIIVETPNNVFLLGTDSDVQIIVGGGNVNISFGLENDVIDVEDGNDNLAGNEIDTTSTVVGTRNDDFLSGTDGDDQISGRRGNDNISGGLGNDVIDGGNGNDLIDGGAGNDLIDGGAGDDTLIGGAGDDTFKGSRGNDSINGGDGFDQADYSKLGKAITLSGVGTITKARGFGTDQVFKVETVIADASVANNTIDASESLPGVSTTADLEAQTISANNVPGLGKLTSNVVNFDNVIGTNEADSIKGDSQNNQLTGLAGDDLIDGRGGDDLIDGGAGNDTIIGGEGKDVLTGGLGADKFIFNSLKEDIDTIKDYNFGQSDVIQVSKVGFGTTKSSDFSYDSSTGNLSFLGNQFAFVENLSSNLSIKLI
ncbi:calcium-binding protein [Nostoc sp. CHAB 5715]|uniref:calcium-binding protein n=1 Tax=Nostoc sp. CHAB 5715 TaxID=2780400 RepID=UPI001E64B980|nr:calcium-binding protein [Nostoc sp. CHAB 5715]MCC5622364.1 hypothetical protein [Nostoc sp. CHAB 5715]